jgi:O-acetyl-ADP-ribose deacetylase (regulator of RNase III)
MIELVIGDILKANVQALVNPVNCVGVMGAGLALQFKQAFPENFQLYKEACKAGQIRTGWMFVVDRGKDCEPRFIINFPTKRHWRNPSELEYITFGMVQLVKAVKLWQIESVAIPPLGCGLGGLKWEDVWKVMYSQLDLIPEVRWMVYQHGRHDDTVDSIPTS